MVSSKIGLIGVGTISDWHVRAIQAVGMEVRGVTTRAGSKRLADFAARHKIGKTFTDWTSMFSAAADFDGWVIASHIDGTPEILKAALDTGLPILVEKPVAWTSAIIEALQQKAHNKVMVGYNRRFYRPVQLAREFFRQNEPLMAVLSIPEGINAAKPNAKGERTYLYPFFENSCHGLDLLRFIGGNVRLESNQLYRLKSGLLAGVSAQFSTDRGDVIRFEGNWGVPANFGLSLERANNKFELKPFEMATLYEGMEVLQPNDEFPIRRYVPKVKERFHLDPIDLVEKPGFVKQAEAFADLIQLGTFSPIAATLEDALRVTRLSEALIGVDFAKACQI